MLIEFVHSLFFLEKIFVNAIEVLMNRHILRNLKLLVEIGMGDSVFPNDLAFVWFDISDDDIQNSGLA